jgi:hypothetical protein
MNIQLDDFDPNAKFDYPLHNDPCFHEWLRRVRVLPHVARLCALEISVCATHVPWPKGGPPFPVKTWRNVLRKVKRGDAVAGLRQLEQAGLIKVWGPLSGTPVVQPIIPSPGDQFMSFACWLAEPWEN